METEFTKLMTCWVSRQTACVKGSVKGRFGKTELRHLQKSQAEFLSWHLLIPDTERTVIVNKLSSLLPHFSKKSLALIL